MIVETETLTGYPPQTEIIENFWLKRRKREVCSWTEHRGINMVMLATGLALSRQDATPTKKYG
ncbi:hypothetical protein [Desulforhabdus amnigena]|uniref:hypothetical protein n=1 Tax=Desulforhabdus amnigena TaxID=40218 RepID=UPI0024927C27|nr:hypothetical protein [Desulforhabdus amnigena]